MKSLQVEIIKRFIGSEKNLAEFLQQYAEARHLARGLNKPSQNDLRIASAVQKSKSVGRTAKELGISQYRVYGALARVSAYQE